MSLVRFKAQNHPQQVARPDVDNRAITDADFAPLQERFKFTIDAAASPENAKLPRYWTVDDDALSQDWTEERVWCNPPYSNIRPWVEKAFDETVDGRWKPTPADEYGDLWYCQLVVMLLPANRTEQGWWQQLVEPERRRQQNGIPTGFRVEFLPGRMRFDRPGAVIGPKGDRPPFGCCLLIWGAS